MSGLDHRRCYAKTQIADCRLCKPRRPCSPRFVRSRISNVTVRETLRNSFITYHALLCGYFQPEKKKKGFLGYEILFYVSVDVKWPMKPIPCLWLLRSKVIRTRGRRWRIRRPGVDTENRRVKRLHFTLRKSQKFWSAPLLVMFALIGYNYWFIFVINKFVMYVTSSCL